MVVSRRALLQAQCGALAEAIVWCAAGSTTTRSRSCRGKRSRRSTAEAKTRSPTCSCTRASLSRQKHGLAMPGRRRARRECICRVPQERRVSLSFHFLCCVAYPPSLRLRSVLLGRSRSGHLGAELVDLPLEVLDLLLVPLLLLLVGQTGLAGRGVGRLARGGQVFLRLDQVDDEREDAREDEREEEGETCQRRCLGKADAEEGDERYAPRR